jgi:hypothetical protein
MSAALRYAQRMFLRRYRWLLVLNTTYAQPRRRSNKAMWPASLISGELQQ